MKAPPPLYRIGNTVWHFSPADFKRFGPDPLALRLRAKSARTLFVRISGEWFRTGGAPRYDDSTAVTACELARIHQAHELKDATR
jgi:hypothetical protein